MTIAHKSPIDVSSGAEASVAALYEALINGWNNSDGEAFAAPFARDGVVIGFDGSEQPAGLAALQVNQNSPAVVSPAMDRRDIAPHRSRSSSRSRL